MEYLRHKQSPVLADAEEPESMFLWQAFHHLRGSRGFGGAIMFSEIAAYCDWVGLTCPVQKARLVKMMIGMDNAERAAHGA